MKITEKYSMNRQKCSPLPLLLMIFVYFLAKTEKQVFKSQYGHSVPLGFICNIQMSYVSLILRQTLFYSLT